MTWLRTTQVQLLDHRNALPEVLEGISIGNVASRASATVIIHNS
ncbi:hypothetical protein [Flavobacterium amniphilum]|nr:hypothetical protein [Flavobacterium amniphilum]